MFYPVKVATILAYNINIKNKIIQEICLMLLLLQINKQNILLYF